MSRRFDGTPEQIPELAQQIITQELEGVLAWAAQGARRLIANTTYTTPSSSKRAVATWRLESDPVATWIDHNTTPDPRSGTFTKDLFLNYSAWSETFRFPVINLNNFSKALVRLLGPPKRCKRGSIHSIQLKSHIDR